MYPEPLAGVINLNTVLSDVYPVESLDIIYLVIYLKNNASVVLVTLILLQ